MALKFKCEKCGGEVVVKYLKPGEEAQCRYCGANVTVPETSVEAGGEPDLKEIRRYRGAGKLPDPLEGYRCPACGGANLKKASSFWFSSRVSERFFRVFKCGDCGARSSVMLPRAVRYWFWYELLGFIICGVFAILIYRMIKDIISILW